MTYKIPRDQFTKTDTAFFGYFSSTTTWTLEPSQLLYLLAELYFGYSRSIIKFANCLMSKISYIDLIFIDINTVLAGFL